MPIDLLGFRPARDPEKASLIKDWVRKHLRLCDETSVMVTELRCSEPGCPPLETVIAVLKASGTRQFKLHRAMADIEEKHVRKIDKERGLHCD